jgi:release factor glutamine methyltransferase
MSPLPSREMRILTAKVLGIPLSHLASECAAFLTPSKQNELDAVIKRRLNHEPLSRILGEAEFWSLPFEVSKDTLEPRPDSETLVEAALKYAPYPDAHLKILDLGTGSGCLLIALLHERQKAFGIGVDRSMGALQTARRNAKLNHVADRAYFLQGDWAASINAEFDLVISNPPYISTSVVETLQPEVINHDPRLALDGGADGLNAYRTIFQNLGKLLKKTGYGLVEIGYDQGVSVPALAREYGLVVLDVINDLAHHPRVVLLQR